jgi:hypothetical protein
MLFNVRLVIETPQGESTVDISAWIEAALTKELPAGCRVVISSVENGISPHFDRMPTRKM